MIKYHLVKGRKRWIMSILMLHPVFKDAIWGGKLLKNFGYEEAGDNAGECWGISAHQNGDCTVANGEFAGKKLHGVMKIIENCLET